QRDHQRRQPGRDALAGGDKAKGPKQGGAGAASDAKGGRVLSDQRADAFHSPLRLRTQLAPARSSRPPVAVTRPSSRRTTCVAICRPSAAIWLTYTIGTPASSRRRTR